MVRAQMKIMQMNVARESRLAAQNSSNFKCENLENKFLNSQLGRKGQMKIMQMTFMIVAVFFFFVLVGLFFLSISFKDVKTSAADLQREQAISSLQVIADMPEISFDSGEEFTVDEDKLRIMAGDFGKNYELFWPVASIGVYKIYPAFDEVVKCPGVGCNYYELFDNGQTDVETYSTYVSICNKVKEFGSVFDRCEVGKLVVGVRK